MQEVKLFIESGDQSNIEQRILDTLKTPDQRIVKFELNEVAEVELDQDEGDIHILCPVCGHWESQPVDQQRHHLQTFEIKEWLDEVKDTERSLMECGGCKQKFIQIWNYKEQEEQEEQIWDYNCSSSIIWGEFDFGRVVASSEQEAIEKAKEEVSRKVREINKRLEGFSSIEVNLDEIVVKQAE